MKKIYCLTTCALLCAIFLLVSGCGATANQAKPQDPVTIKKSFQTVATPLPKVPVYRCGAWTINNTPGAFSTITINARLMKSLGNDGTTVAVAGAPATAIAHFQGGDVPLDMQPVSDEGGYVAFTLSLQGRQPPQVPATVDVSFTVDGKTVQCSPAFFAPR